MANPDGLTRAEKRMGFHELKYLRMRQQRPGWYEVKLLMEKSHVVMQNNYVELRVFDWLAEHVGEPTEFIRLNKHAGSANWSYCMDKAGVHVFVFEDVNKAMMFKLTWG